MNSSEDYSFIELRQCFSLPGLFFLFVVLGACYLVVEKDLTIAVACGAAIGLVTAGIGVAWKKSTSHRFSIRGILAFTAFVAIFVAWQQHWFISTEAAISRIKELGGHARVNERSGAPPESDAQFIKQDILPRHLNYLRSLPNLTHLDLDYTTVGDEGMSYVGKLTDLEWLDVEDTGVTDDGLRRLHLLQSLTKIIVDGNDVTDAGLMHLSKLKSLKSVRLLGTKVTDEGVQRFKIELPGCTVQIQ